VSADDPILLTGGSGQIGSALLRLAEHLGQAVVAPTRAELDLCAATSVADVVVARPWSMIVNCAAYTAVDRAESEPDLAYRVNAEAPRLLARSAADRGIPLLHVSTDYVFDGRKAEPYFEDDPVSPLGIYGKSKAEGEVAVAEAGGIFAIVRTAWVLSAGRGNFLDTMLRLATERDEVSVVSDQIGCPTSAQDIAAALLTIGARLGERQGVWHCVNSGNASWYHLAGYIFDYIRAHDMRVPNLRAITSDEYPTPAKRPLNSIFSTAKLQEDFGIAMRPWQNAVSEILEQRRTRRGMV
jgi:dTDP-4-dehydrorhamnose reductase